MTATDEHPPLPAGPLTVADLEAFPDDGPGTPQLHAYALDETGRYQLVARVAGEEVFRAEQPFPVEIRPADLVRRRA